MTRSPTSQHSTEPANAFLTRFDHHEVQRVVPDVGDGSNIVDGHSEDDVFSVAPHELYVVRRQAHHGVLLRRQLAGQLMGLLRNTGGGAYNAGNEKN